MATKWKSKYLVVIVGLLLSLGWIACSLSIYRVAMNPKGMEWNKAKIHESINYLYVLQLLENMQEDTTLLNDVSMEQVENYRNTYGNLGEQVENIVDQYNTKTRDISKEEKKKLLAERDKKIESVIVNFSDTDAVKKKIVRERKEWLRKNSSKNQKLLKKNIKWLNDNFNYYFVDDSGRIYTNVKSIGNEKNKKKIEQELKKQGIGELSKENVYADILSFGNEEWFPYTLFMNYVSIFNGSIVIKKDSKAAEHYQESYLRTQRGKIVFGIGLVLLIVGLVLMIVYLRQPMLMGKMAVIVKKTPIDIRLAFFILLGIITSSLSSFIPTYEMLMGNFMWMMQGVIVILLQVFVMICGLVIVKNTWWSIKKYDGFSSIKEQWSNSFYAKCGNGIVKKFMSLSVKLRMVLFLLLAGSLLGWLFLRYLFGNNLFLLLFMIEMIGLLMLVRPFVNYRQRQEILLKKPQETLIKIGEKTVEDISLQEMEKDFEELQQLVFQSQLSNQQSEQLKTELLTNVSHDLRTPLTSLITYGDLLTKEDVSEADRKEYIQIINRKTSRLKSLIDDLFEVTKMNNGEIELNKTEINMGQLIQQAVAEYNEELENKKLKLCYSKPTEAIMVNVDGEKMWRVFDNLISNVVKYSLSGTRVHLKLLENDGQIIIQLKNISKYELNEDGHTLLERFKRGDESRHTEGSGLGLAIVNSIIDLHGGMVNIEVDGDMFKVTIYLMQP